MARERRLSETTVESRLFDELRNRIVRGLVEPDQPLPLMELADEFGVSTMPVRAALRRLEAEGLVRYTPHRGASVAPIEREDLEEIQAIRSGLESFAARLGAVRVVDRDVQKLERLLEKLDETGRTMTNNPDTYLRLDWALHDVCYAASDRPRLQDLIGDYRRRAERYIRLALVEPEGYSHSSELHHWFVKACRERDGQAAEEAVRSAMAWTVEQVTPIFASASVALTSEI